MSAGLGTTLRMSIVLHMLGFSAVALLSGWRRVPPPPPVLMTTELLVPPPAPVEPAVALAPEPEPVPDPTPAAAVPPPLPVTPPRLVETPKPERIPVHDKPPPPVTRVRTREMVPPRPPAPTRVAARTPMRAAAPPAGPISETPAAGGPGSGTKTARIQETSPAPPTEGSEAGAGQLFARGDVGVTPGTGAGGGGGGSGRAGLGTGGVGTSGTRVASVDPGAGGGGSGSALARPLGGYQVKPRYPEAARRQGVEGTTLLKVHVNAQGLVADVLVASSAGYAALDLAAMEAVRQWKFEPAKQGQQAVAVWVMLPVRFTLR